MLKTVGFPSTRTGDQTIIDGNLVIGTAGKGIDFSVDGQAAGMTSELLNDYEEGTFTPVIADATTGGNTGTASTATGTYTKVGRLVHITITLVNMNTTGMTAGNTLYIRGLPYTCSAQNTPLNCFVDSINFTNFVTPSINASTSHITLQDNIDSANDVFMLVSSLTSAVADIFISGSYSV